MNECWLTPEEMQYVAYPRDSIVFWVGERNQYNVVFPWHPDYVELADETNELP